MRWVSRRGARARTVLLSLLLAVALAVGTLVWARSPVTVRVLMPAPFADATAATVADFNRRHRDMRIAVTRGPFETEAVSDLAISSLLLGDSPYDLLLVDVTWTAKYARAGWLLPLDDWLGEDPLEPLVAGARVGNRIDGSLWRLPLVADMGLLYWRTDLMDTPPQTPEELVATSRRLQQEGKVRWGYVWQGRQYEGLSCVFVELIEAFGGHWGGGDGMGLDRPAAARAASWMRDLITTGITPAAVTNFAEPEVLQTFESGDAAFMRNWPYAWQELQKPTSAVAGKVGITTMVAEPGGTHAATQGSWGLAVLAGTPHRAEAITALKALTGEDSQRQLVKQWGYTPTFRELFEDPELVALQPQLPVLQRALEVAVLRPITPAYAQLSDILQRKLSQAISGVTVPRLAMERAGKGSRQLLEAIGKEPTGRPEATPEGEP